MLNRRKFRHSAFSDLKSAQHYALILVLTAALLSMYGISDANARPDALKSVSTAYSGEDGQYIPEFHPDYQGPAILTTSAASSTTYANSSATYGILRANAFAGDIGEVNNSNERNGAIASSSFYQEDINLSTPGVISGSGFARFQIRLTGQLNIFGETRDARAEAHIGMISDGKLVGRREYILDASRQRPLGVVVGCLPEDPDCVEPPDDDDFPRRPEELVVNEILTTSAIPVELGISFSFPLQVSLHVEAENGGEVMFGNTLQFIGATVTDDQGNEISDFSLASPAYDFRTGSAIPEPTSAVLLIIAALALSQSRRL